MAWPSGNKAVTTTTDADSDSISGARVDINKTISNVNDIIDIFNIPGSPTDNYILKYNASASRFDMEADSGGTITGVTNMVDDRVITASGATTLNAEQNMTFDGTTLAVVHLQMTGPGSGAGECKVKANSGNLILEAAGTIDPQDEITMNTNKITGMGDPTAAQDAATKAYVDSVSSAPTINNNADNRIITGSGSANTLNAESTLQYDGTSLSNTTAPTFTAGSTPIQLNGTQPNQGGYYGHLTVDTGTSRGAYTYSSRTAGGNMDRHIFFYDLDDDFGARPSGAYQGDFNVWFNGNHSTSKFDMFIDGFDTAAIQVFGHNGNSYALQNFEINAADIKHKIGGTAIVSIDSDSVDITQDVVITDTEQLKFGTTTTIDKNEITTTGGFTVNVDSDNSSNESFLIQSAGTDVMSFQRGPGGDAEMTVKGDGFFIKDDQDDVQFSMDMSSGSQTGINVFRTNENKSLSFALKTDDNDDTGNFDGTWSFRQDANKKKMEFERTDSSTVTIFEVRDSADSATADPTDIFEFKIPPVVPSYAVGSLPTTVVAGAQALATGCNTADVSTGTAMAFYDGSNWKYTHLPATTVRT